MRRVGPFISFLIPLIAISLSASSCKYEEKPAPPRRPPVETASEPDPGDNPAIELPIFSEPLPAGIAPHALRLQKRANEGDDNAALELGEWLVTGDGIPSDAVRAAGLFASLCHKKNSDGCGHLADLYLRGVGVRRNVGHAIRMFDDACTGGSAWACSRIGAERLWATSVGFDIEKGLMQARKGCDGLDPMGCYVVERAIYKRITKHGDKNTRRALLTKASHARQAACRAKNKFYACSLYAKNDWTADHTDRRYGGDRELQQDDDDAGTASNTTKTTTDGGVSAELEEACSGGDYHACMSAGTDAMWARYQKPCAEGDYRACNVTLPLGDLPKLCRGGDCEACHDLASETDAKADKHKADFQAACSLGCLDGCRAYVEHAPTKETKEVTSRRVFACEKNLASACLAIASDDSKDSDAQLLLFRACPEVPRYTTGGDWSAKACKLAGDFLVRGSPAEAEKLYLRACYTTLPWGGRAFEACRRLGELAESKKDNGKALVHYAAACLPDESTIYDRASCLKVRELATALPYQQRVNLLARLDKLVGVDGGAR
jgi:hypothetical protein